MNVTNLPINWFDFLVVVVLLLGAQKGRKNGMSQEVVVCLQWVAIVLTCAFLYQPLGDMLVQSSPVSHLFAYISVYIGIALIVKMIFSFIKKSAGGKLTGNDAFGSFEYPLGMVAGAIRYACILLAALALLNARAYSKQEVNKAIAVQKEVYGSPFFPGLYSVQGDVFQGSFIGKQVSDYAGILLIKPTAPENKPVQRRKDDLP